MRTRFAFPLGILLAFVAFGSLATIYNPPAASVETDPVFLAAKDTDGTLAADSDTKVPSQRAVVSYVGTKEDSLGFPSTNGYVLSSTIGGTRSWITPGTVTSFSAGDLSPLFTTSEATVTTTPVLTFSLSTHTANTVFAGPTTGSAAAPTFRALVAADIPSLSGTYQPLDGDLTSLAAASSTDALYYRSAANTWSPVTIGTNLRLSSGVLDADISGGITNTAGATIIPVSDGTNLIASSITDDAGSLVSGGYNISKFVFDNFAGTSTIGDPDGNGAGAKLVINNNDGSVNLYGATFGWNGVPFDFNTFIVAGGAGSSRAGSFSGVGTATTSFVVNIGALMANNTYKVNVTPTAALSAAFFYISAKTTTTFTVTYLAGLTGTVTFDWAVFP